jgi:pimeloyl-ACP methyl ester carboxylesterase
MVKRFLIVAVSMFTSLAANADSFKIETATGYKTSAYVHEAKGQVRGITIVMLHGKGGKPGASQYSGFYKDLRKAGYTIIAPRMPYSRFDAGYGQTIAVIDAAVAEAVKRGNHVVIAGHSMGATISLHYGSNHHQKDIIGIMPIALGHSPELSGKLMSVTGESVMAARQMAESGKGAKKKSFKDLNAGRVSTIRTTADIYLSYYDPQVFPKLANVLPNIQVPVFWLSGSEDRLRYVYEAEDNFNSIPPNPKSKYLEGKGGHKTVVYKQTSPMIDWLNSL